jgi:hypothetical protein
MKQPIRSAPPTQSKRLDMFHTSLRHESACHDVALTIVPRYARRQEATINSGNGIREAAMTTFDKREEGFEKQFAHDEELKFKATSRRNKLLGLWAAEKLGLAGDAANAYAKEVVMADFEEAGEDDVFRKVRKDFDATGVAATDQEIRAMMVELMGKAIEQIKSGT